jgi:hypothetical protein
MLVILADRRDADAGVLVDRWRGQDARILSIDDVLSEGWCHRIAAPAETTAVVSGRIVPVAAITGVLTLLPWVAPAELVHIMPEDRNYIAAEAMAFLLSWLSDLPCPVMNRPRPPCLMGPNWRDAQWVHTAAGLGIPVRPIHRRAARGGEPLVRPAGGALATVTVIGRQCLGRAHPALAEHASRLAAAAGVSMLAVHFDGTSADARLLGAELRPDLAKPEIADAILLHLEGAGAC